MVNLILVVSLVYLIQLILPLVLKRKSTEAIATRAAKALHNLRESLPVFFALAVLSSYLGVDANFNIALTWLILRMIYGYIYISGVSLKPVDKYGYEALPVRGLLWFGSIICLIVMGSNLIL